MKGAWDGGHERSHDSVSASGFSVYERKTRESLPAPTIKLRGKIGREF